MTALVQCSSSSCEASFCLADAMQEVLFGDFDESSDNTLDVEGQDPKEPGKKDTPHESYPKPVLENKENHQESKRQGSGEKLVPEPKLDGVATTLAPVPLLKEVSWS